MQLQQFGAPDDVLIRVAEQPGGDAAQQAAVTKVRGALGSDVDYRRVEVVGPRVSGELLSYGVIGLMLAILCILIYLWFRFEWQFALGAMIANVHDLVLTIGFMSVTGIDFDLTSIAALLTILGYSLNDTVVIYDRIREMLRRYRKMPMPDLLNASVNQTLSRSVITHVTVSLALLALLLFGGQAIHSFTATMMFGVVLVGTYTSVFIASPILIYLGVGTGRDALSASRRRSRTSRRTGRNAMAGGLGADAPHLPSPGADRCLRQWRFPLRRHVAPRLDPVPARRHLGLAGGERCGAERSRAGAGVRARRRRSICFSSAAAAILSPCRTTCARCFATPEFPSMPGHRAGGADLQYPAGGRAPRRRRTDRGLSDERAGHHRRGLSPLRADRARAGQGPLSRQPVRAGRAAAAFCLRFTPSRSRSRACRSLVQEPMTGTIRLQWWIEALCGLRAEEAAASPVMIALQDAARQTGVALTPLIAAIEARQAELHGEPAVARCVGRLCGRGAFARRRWRCHRCGGCRGAGGDFRRRADRRRAPATPRFVRSRRACRSACCRRFSPSRWCRCC